MNGTLEEAAGLIDRIRQDAAETARRVDLLVIPPFTALADASRRLRADGPPVSLGAQDLHWEAQGAFTGEVSGRMLRNVGCSHVLVGHSERRTIFGEKGDVLKAKLSAALREGLIPILCIGENLGEREAERTEEVLDSQLDETLFRIAPDEAGAVVLAYEPVWAIGTGRNATPQQVAHAHHFIRSRLEAILGGARADGIRILYGGSVNAKNAGELLACPGVDGALVGGASLRADEFLAIARAAPGPSPRGRSAASAEA